MIYDAMVWPNSHCKCYFLKNCIAVLPPEIVVHRITGDGAKKDLIAPGWSADKKKTLNYSVFSYPASFHGK